MCGNVWVFILIGVCAAHVRCKFLRSISSLFMLSDTLFSEMERPCDKPELTKKYIQAQAGRRFILNHCSFNDFNDRENSCVAVIVFNFKTATSPLRNLISN